MKGNLVSVKKRHSDGIVVDLLPGEVTGQWEVFDRRWVWVPEEHLDSFLRMKKDFIEILNEKAATGEDPNRLELVDDVQRRHLLKVSGDVVRRRSSMFNHRFLKYRSYGETRV